MSDGFEKMMEGLGIVTQVLIIGAAMIISIPYWIIGLVGYRLGLWE